jgi:hypothetical protein
LLNSRTETIAPSARASFGMSGFDPGCVKTRTRTKREERYSSDGQSHPQAQHGLKPSIILR